MFSSWAVYEDDLHAREQVYRVCSIAFQGTGGVGLGLRRRTSKREHTPLMPVGVGDAHW